MNDYYDSTGAPGTKAVGSSATMRAEFDAIEAAFGKLPPLVGNGGKFPVINDPGTAQTVKTVEEMRALIGGILDRNLTQVEVISTTTETEIYRYTVPANTLGTNRMLHLMAFCTMQTGLIENINFKIYYGATLIVSGTLSSSGEVPFFLEFFLLGNGASNSQRGILQFSGTGVDDYNTASEDSTVDKDLIITATPSNNSATDKVNLYNVQLDIK